MKEIKVRIRPSITEDGKAGFKVQYKKFLFWIDFPSQFDCKVYSDDVIKDVADQVYQNLNYKVRKGE